ncbi:MAG TPA: alpha/beta fold hydrolase [Nocardioidaceae bacterium]|nr:alpha/beta fold hydrolase [Nocardioidaceae bacterium]
MRPPPIVAAVAAVVLLAGGCSTSSSPQGESPDRQAESPAESPAVTPETPAPREEPASTPPAPERLQRFYGQDVSWRPCQGGGFECTKVRVPLDYADPSAGTVSLAVSRRPADEPGRRIGAILINPGGPGASGISFAPTAAAQFRSDVLDRYDIVGFDPRGVAASEGIDCLTDGELDAFVALDPTPDDPAAVSEAQQAIADFGRGCVEGSGELAGHVSTPEAARDMDIIRAAVDSPQFHFYGASYGTLLGATYADLHPERVGRMVLDGAVDPAQSVLQENLKAAAGFETALRAYLQFCVDQGECPLGTTVPAAQDRLNALLDRIDATPLPAGAGRELTTGHAVLGVWLPLYVPELWPTLSVALQQAANGDGSALMRLSDLYTSRGPGGYRDNSLEALYAVNCLDQPTGRSTQEIRRLLPRFRQASPTFGEVFAWFLIGCPEWPVRTAEPMPTIDAPGAPPIVVIGTTGDPATPYESAVALAEQLRSGVLVTRVGEGHTGFGRGNECVDEAVNDFFAAGEVPENGLRCAG